MIKQSWFSLKNIFFAIFIVSFLPGLLKTVQHYIKNELKPHTKVGCLTITTLTDSSFYVKQIHTFLKDTNIKGLLLKIKSPGGLPGTSQTLFSELLKFNEKKPVVALIEDIGASGGYYVALGAQKIIATPSALVGSIGARMMKANIGNFLKAHKIEVDEISSGKFKTTTSFLREKTSEELAYLQQLSDDIYEQFVNDVATRRNLSLDNQSTWADGKIFTGRQAFNLQLIDKLGSINEAKEELANCIVERGEPLKGELKCIYPPRLHGLAKLLYGNENGECETSLSSQVASFIVNVCEKVHSLQETKNPVSL